MENMKKRILITLLALSFFLPAYHAQAQTPVAEAIKEGVKKVIKAIDLEIQRMQTKTIGLQNAQKVLENAMSKLKLQQIAAWTEKQRNLYSAYYQDLWQVKSIIATYRQVTDVIRRQKQLVQEYQNAWGLLKKDSHFTPQELDEMYRVYSGILAESLKNLDQLTLVVNSFATQMSDAGRLKLIRSAADGIEENLSDLRAYNNRNFRVSLSRVRAMQDATITKKLYGLY